MAEVERTLGEHGARLTAVEDDIAEIKADVKMVLKQMAEAQGGWKMLMMVGGASATLGGLLATYLPKLFK